MRMDINMRNSFFIENKKQDGSQMVPFCFFFVKTLFHSNTVLRFNCSMIDFMIFCLEMKRNSKKLIDYKEKMDYYNKKLNSSQKSKKGMN
ncbi:hypothetical protein ABD74_07850 [Brevibacillus laterosporus]|nr:hypothetical protein [Brevibacillus laterosporus]